MAQTLEEWRAEARQMLKEREEDTQRKSKLYPSMQISDEQRAEAARRVENRGKRS